MHRLTALLLGELRLIGFAVGFEGWLIANGEGSQIGRSFLTAI